MIASVDVHAISKKVIDQQPRRAEGRVPPLSVRVDVDLLVGVEHGLNSVHIPDLRGIVKPLKDAFPLSFGVDFLVAGAWPWDRSAWTWCDPFQLGQRTHRPPLPTSALPIPGGAKMQKDLLLWPDFACRNKLAGATRNVRPVGSRVGPLPILGPFGWEWGHRRCIAELLDQV